MTDSKFERIDTAVTVTVSGLFCIALSVLMYLDITMTF